MLARSGSNQPAEWADFVRQIVPVIRIDISSSLIRSRVAAGEPIHYLVPDAVREIIEREGLYR
jgi:nicotinate-nucleotide adenylyltransferase